MPRPTGPIADGQPPGGRPPIGTWEQFRADHALLDILDALTDAAVRAGMPETQARSRVVRRLIRAGGAMVDRGHALPPPTVEPLTGRVSVTLDDPIRALIGSVAAGRDGSDVVRALIMLGLEYSGPELDDPRPWEPAYAAALEHATGDQADALRARLGRPEATEKQLAESLGVSLGAYKSRVQRALKRAE